MLASSSTIRILCMLVDGRRAHSLGNDGQFNNELGADGLVFLHADCAVVILDDAADNRQAKSRTSLFGRKIRQKQTLLQLWRNSMPGIGYHNFDGVMTTN